MATHASLANALDSLAQTGTLDTCSPKQALEHISNTIYDYYALNATIAISTLEAMVQSLSKSYGSEKAMSMLIKSLKTVKS